MVFLKEFVDKVDIEKADDKKKYDKFSGDKEVNYQLKQTHFSNLKCAQISLKIKVPKYSVLLKAYELLCVSATIVLLCDYLFVLITKKLCLKANIPCVYVFSISIRV